MTPRTGPDDAWRHDNVGRLLHQALRRFEGRVIELMAAAGHDAVSPSHVNATRHLDLAGTRLTTMAQRAAMTKQSMAELVAQLEQRGLVTRQPDPADGRARLVHFTPQGLAWLDDFRVAVQQAEREMAQSLGAAPLQALRRALRDYGAGAAAGLRPSAHAPAPPAR